MKAQGYLRLQVEQSSLAVLASLQLWSVVLPKSQVQQLSATKTSVVFIERHTMPCSYMEVATALWESTDQSCFKEDRFFEQVWVWGVWFVNCIAKGITQCNTSE